MKQSASVGSEPQQAKQFQPAADMAHAGNTPSFVDNRPETIALRQLKDAIRSNPEIIAQRNRMEQFHNNPRMIAQRTEPGYTQSPVPHMYDGMEYELLQGKLDAVQRIEEEEPLQGKFAIESPAQREQQPAVKPNNTGLPDNLKSGIESLSSMSMDSVHVHYNSSQPAQLNALAYAQGTDIHVAPGQEQHLPHEAWHVVQQAQGRVQPTMQMKDGVPINDDTGLEHEADVMGVKALQMHGTDQVTAGSTADATSSEQSTEVSGFSREAIKPSEEKGRFNSLSTTVASPSIKPIQRIIGVAGFQAATPATMFHGRGPNILALDVALGTYIGARTIANANALVTACNGYLGGQHQAVRIAAATALRNHAQAEYQLLTQIGNGNAHLVDALLTQVGGIGGYVLNLVQLATQVGNANANTLPNLINTVTPAQMGALVASGVIPAIGAANAHLLVQLLPMANGVAGLPALTALINASGAANIPLLAPMIPLIGGHAQIPTLTAMLVAQGVGADAAFDLARVAGTNGVLFARLCGELPHFQRTAPPGGVPGPVGLAQANYNVAKVAAPLNALNMLHAQATVAYNRALPFAAPPLGGYVGGIPAGLMNSVLARIGTVNGDIAAIGGGVAINAGHRTHANQLRTVVMGALNGQLTGLGIAVPPAFALAVAAVGNVPNPFDAANNAPSITNISFDHFLTRHTAHYFDFGEIKPDNTQWPTAWAVGASAQVEARLATLLGTLHGGSTWLMPGVPLPGQAVAGGTAQIAGLLDAGVVGNLRLGQFFPEAGANFLDHDAATMRAIDRLV